ncbi:toxin biosynthesis protein-like protein, partial [Aureobasidium melanogenum]
MSSFRIVEHTIPAQHIREWPRALAESQEDVLQLAVKQYIPKDNAHPQPGDVTIIGAHANGFPKELYEPLWDEIHARLRKSGIRIRSIWIADVAHQGHSSVLNEQLLGNDPSWFDHSRDLLHLINLKRHEMPRPLIGVGHSMGGAQLVNLAYMHPRLLTTLILIDPVIQKYSSVPPDVGPSPARLSTFRRDVWPSRQEAAKGFESSKFYQTWDPRVLDLWIRDGLRDMPTLIHPEDPPKVTLTTPLHQEVFTFLRPNYEGYGHNGKPVNRKTHPDLNPGLPGIYPFYRAEGPQTFFRLPELRPSVLYVFGGKSDVGTPENCKAKMEATGVGVGGSGGAPAGRVKSVLFEDVGHLIAMEAVDRTADHASAWIAGELEIWKRDEEEHNRVWQAKSLVEKQTVDEQWKKMIGGPLRKPKQTKL